MHLSHASPRPWLLAVREDLRAGDVFLHLHRAHLVHFRVFVVLQENHEGFRGKRVLGDRGGVLPVLVEGDGRLGMRHRHLEEDVLGGWRGPLISDAIFGNVQVGDSNYLRKEKEENVRG